MKEIWKNVVNYEGYYEVSNRGNLRSLDRTVKGRSGFTAKRKGMMLKYRIDDYGYCISTLNKNAVGINKKRHRLVAESFIPNPGNKPQVNHKNGIKTDNRVDNLEWVTGLENQQHAHKLGLFKNLYTKKQKLHGHQIIQTTLNNVTKEWVSLRELGRNGYDRKYLSEILRNNSKTLYKNSYWRYK